MQSLVDRLRSTNVLRTPRISANSVTICQRNDGTDKLLWTAVNGQVRQPISSKALLQVVAARGPGGKV
jgi:hypothetical protein